MKVTTMKFAHAVADCVTIPQVRDHAFQQQILLDYSYLLK